MNSRLAHRLTLAGCVLSWLLFVVSLAFPAFLVEWPRGSTQEYPSLAILLIGWLGVLMVLDGYVGQIAWIANPLLVLTSMLLLTRKSREALIVSGVMIVFAAANFLLQTVLMDEGGGEAPIIGYGLGFYLWWAAILLQAGASLIPFIGSTRDQQPVPVTDFIEE